LVIDNGPHARTVHCAARSALGTPSASPSAREGADATRAASATYATTGKGPRAASSQAASSSSWKATESATTAADTPAFTLIGAAPTHSPGPDQQVGGSQGREGYRVSHSGQSHGKNQGGRACPCQDPAKGRPLPPGPSRRVGAPIVLLHESLAVQWVSRGA
jgi:hypothetical protein